MARPDTLAPGLPHEYVPNASHMQTPSEGAGLLLLLCISAYIHCGQIFAAGGGGTGRDGTGDAPGIRGLDAVGSWQSRGIARRNKSIMDPFGVAGPAGFVRAAALELAAASAAWGARALFGSLLRGFAAVAAVKLLLRRGARGVPAAAALLALPAAFGCLALADGLAQLTRIFSTSRRHPRALVTRIARAASMIGNLDAALAALPSRALRPPSSATSVWARPPNPRPCREGCEGGAGRRSGRALALRAASACRRWLLVAAAASLVAPFVALRPERWLSTQAARAAVVLWLLMCGGTRRRRAP